MPPMPTVTYNNRTYKVRSRKTEIPDLDAMDGIAASMWLIQNTYPRGQRDLSYVPSVALACKSWPESDGGRYPGLCLIADSDGCECPCDR